MRASRLFCRGVNRVLPATRVASRGIGSHPGVTLATSRGPWRGRDDAIEMLFDDRSVAPFASASASSKSIACRSTATRPRHGLHGVDRRPDARAVPAGALPVHATA